MRSSQCRLKTAFKSSPLLRCVEQGIGTIKEIFGSFIGRLIES